MDYEENKDSPTKEELVSFVLSHTDRWREWRDQNYLDDWNKYERIFRGKWAAEDKYRGSERSKIISPATQQAIETRHAEIMEAIFGQGEFFDIKDDLQDKNGNVDVEIIKNQLSEDFARDKIKKSIDQCVLMSEIYGTGIGEIIVGSEKNYHPATMPIDASTQAYGVMEKDRIFVKINPTNPKNFLFDPNGTSIEDCMGVAVERYVSIHQIAKGIEEGKYDKFELSCFHQTDDLEPTQETKQYHDDKILLLTYYGLVPSEYLNPIELKEDEEIEEVFEGELEDYTDMVEAIVVIANGKLLKAEETPYSMKDRPIVYFQNDTVPNRLLGRGTAEKSFNMQAAIDGSVRSHMDSLALTVHPMMGVDSTRLPRGANMEVKPGKQFFVNGNPQEVLFPFKFGTTDGQAMETSKEFERMLLMATGTLDSQGMVSAISRDAGGLNAAVSTIIKKYKRTLINFQEDFLIPFINKAAWRYMQFDPERYPSVDVKFIPTGSLGVLAREYEQQRLAFMIQTLGDKSPLTPILMQGVVENSSLPKREQMLQQLEQASKPDPQAQQMQMMKMQKEIELIDAQINEIRSRAMVNTANAQKASVDASLAPEETKAKVISAISRNLPAEDNEANAEFDRRVQIAELMMKEEEIKVKKADILSNERIASAQMNKGY